MAGRVFFVSGIDTGVGKTVVTGLLARWLLRQGRRVVTVKMVQTGNDGVSEDLQTHRLLMGGVALPEDGEGLTAPQIFHFPASPLLAATLEHATLDLERIRQSVATLAARYEVVLVEGAGGLGVPLNERVLAADFAAEQGWPLILVTSGKLGSINHTVLSIEAAAARGMTLAGIVYNWCPEADPTIDEDTPNYLRRYLQLHRVDAPLVFAPHVPDLRQPPETDFAALFAAPSREADLERLAALDRRHLWHPYASIENPPPVHFAEQSHGTRIRLADGTELLDAVSSWWCVAHGHNHPAIMEAIRRQSRRMSHVMFGGFTHRPATLLVERLLELLPAGLDAVFLADSGSIAVECAVKMAVQYHYAAGHPERCKMVALKGAYHGDTAGAMALSDPDGMHILFQGVMPRHYFAEQPKSPFRGAWIDADFASMERILDGHGGEIAGVIVEPVFQGGNAMWLYHPEYLRRLRALCDRHGALLVFDEVATGFGRTGRLFAMEHAGVVPDILCVGKTLTGGSMTLAAAIASRRVAEVISSRGSGAFMHGPTYMGNPLACAAAKASLDLLGQYDWKGNLAAIEAGFRDGLSEFKGHPNVRDVRWLGGIGILELEHMPTAAQTARNCRETGVWLRPFGQWVYSMPPFITTPSEVEQITRAMGRLAELGWENRLVPARPSSDPILDIHE